MSELKFRRKLEGALLKICLGDFADLVHDGVFEKFDYPTWRTLSKIVDSVDVSWVYPSATEAAVITISHQGKDVGHFAANDDSFGEFLYENCLEEYEKMLTNSCYPSGTAGTNTSATNGTYSLTIDAKSTISNDTPLFTYDTKSNYTHPTYITAEPTTINKENVKMKAFNFDFGPVNGNIIRMSMYGLAVKNKAGTYVSYNVDNDEIMDVDIFNFDGAQFLYKMPVAIKDITVGDVVVHQNIPMFVVEVPTDGKTLYAVDPVNGEKKEIMLARSPFGFNFATKVVNFLGGMFNGTADSENPFGNMWMLMAMGDNKDMNSMLPMMLMAQGGSMDPSAMMMMMAMMDKDNKSNDMLPLMFAMQGMAKPATTKTHTCTCNCGNHEG